MQGYTVGIGLQPAISSSAAVRDHSQNVQFPRLYRCPVLAAVQPLATTSPLVSDSICSVPEIAVIFVRRGDHMVTTGIGRIGGFQFSSMLSGAYRRGLGGFSYLYWEARFVYRWRLDGVFGKPLETP